MRSVTPKKSDWWIDWWNTNYGDSPDDENSQEMKQQPTRSPLSVLPSSPDRFLSSAFDRALELDDDILNALVLGEMQDELSTMKQELSLLNDAKEKELEQLEDEIMRAAEKIAPSHDC